MLVDYCSADEKLIGKCIFAIWGWYACAHDFSKTFGVAKTVWSDEMVKEPNL